MAQLGVTEQRYEEISRSLLEMRQNTRTGGTATDILEQQKKDVKTIQETATVVTFTTTANIKIGSTTVVSANLNAAANTVASVTLDAPVGTSSGSTLTASFHSQ